jgi:hypothetical protein
MKSTGLKLAQTGPRTGESARPRCPFCTEIPGHLKNPQRILPTISLSQAEIPDHGRRSSGSGKPIPAGKRNGYASPLHNT